MFLIIRDLFGLKTAKNCLKFHKITYEGHSRWFQRKILEKNFFGDKIFWFLVDWPVVTHPLLFILIVSQMELFTADRTAQKLQFKP